MAGTLTFDVEDEPPQSKLLTFVDNVLLIYTGHMGKLIVHINHFIFWRKLWRFQEKDLQKKLLQNLFSPRIALCYTTCGNTVLGISILDFKTCFVVWYRTFERLSTEYIFYHKKAEPLILKSYRITKFQSKKRLAKIL